MNVFISSTFTDLEEIRRDTLNFFNQFAMTPLAMEVWSSAKDDPVRRCLDKVRESNLFIGIYGQRYGFIPDGYDVSITELEYLEARKNNIDILVFIMNDEYPVKVKYIDRGENLVLLEDFKSKLKKNHYLSFFSSNSDYNEKLNSSFRDYLSDKKIDMKDLNFKSIYKELEEIYGTKNIPIAFKMNSNNLDSLSNLVTELENQIEGLKVFHEHVWESYERLESDLYSVLNKFGISQNDVRDKIEYYNNPFVNRDWAMITFFPNRIIELEKVSMALRLVDLSNRAKQEPWSIDLVTEINLIKRQLTDHLVEKEYLD